MYEPQLEAEALSEACGVPTVRLDHVARFGQPLLVLVSVHAVQQVGVASERDQIVTLRAHAVSPAGDAPAHGTGVFREIYRAVRGTRFATLLMRMPVSTGKV